MLRITGAYFKVVTILLNELIWYISVKLFVTSQLIRYHLLFPKMSASTISIFSEYFQKHLHTNPYFDEIKELLKEKEDTQTQITSNLSLEDGIESMPIGHYRISTMTCIYDFNTTLDEQKIYEIGERIIDTTKSSFDSSATQFKVIGVECFDKPIIGEQIQKKRGKLSTRKFRNQITLIIWSGASEKHIKVKLFRTGRAQMTGVTSERDGINCVAFLCSLLNENKDYLELEHDLDGWSNSCWSIAMMNGDFDVGRTVSREVLNSVICRKYGIISNLDADTYPGVIMKYNIENKQITISVFSSGKVIITGANSTRQIETCVRLVRFLCSLV